MGGFAAFLIRLVAYAFVLGIADRIAQSAWSGYALDGNPDLTRFHDLGVLTLEVAPLVLALFGGAVLQRLAIFLAALLAGAAITAPYALERISAATGA